MLDLLTRPKQTALAAADVPDLPDVGNVGDDAEVRRLAADRAQFHADALALEPFIVGDQRMTAEVLRPILDRLFASAALPQLGRHWTEQVTRWHHGLPQDVPLHAVAELLLRCEQTATKMQDQANTRASTRVAEAMQPADEKALARIVAALGQLQAAVAERDQLWRHVSMCGYSVGAHYGQRADPMFHRAFRLIHELLIPDGPADDLRKLLR